MLCAFMRKQACRVYRPYMGDMISTLPREAKLGEQKEKRTKKEK